MLYLAWRSEDDPNFGQTKLNKLLCLADFHAYGTRGQSITHQPYRRMEYGPAPRFLVQAQRELFKSKAAVLVERESTEGTTQQRLIPIREFTAKYLTADDITSAEKALEWLKHATATEAMNRSHRWLPWLVTPPGEDIPYELVFFDRPAEVSSSDVDFLKATEEKCG